MQYIGMVKSLALKTPGGSMDIGKRLKDLRVHKKLSQGDIEQRTGLLRCYVSRVENGHTVPAIETIEKMARALEMPMYQLFIDAEKSPAFGNAKGKSSSARKQDREFSRFTNLVAALKKRDKDLLFSFGSALAGRKK